MRRRVQDVDEGRIADRGIVFLQEPGKRVRF
jgi:hypothetical protein